MSSNARRTNTEQSGFAAQSGWCTAGVLALLSGAFLLWRLPSPDGFLIRPQAAVSDYLVTFWPNIHYLRQTWLDSGQIPLWRTLIFSGSPLVGDPQSGLGYWPNLLFFLLPEAVGFNLLLWVHLTLGAVGMWLWARSSRLRAAGRMLSALAWLFFPPLYAHWGFGHVGLVYAAAWTPWALMAGQQMGRGRWHWGAVLGWVLGWQVSTHPQIALYTAGVTALVGVFAFERGRASAGRLLAGPVLAGALTLAIAAPTLLPMATLAPLTGRTRMGPHDAQVSSLPWRYLLGIVFPDYRGYADYMVYLGAPLLALSLLGLLVRRRRLWWGMALAGMVGYALGDNLPLYRILLRLLPPLAWMRAPSRVWVVLAPILLLLAGQGLDSLQIGVLARPTLQRFLKVWGALSVALLVFVLGFVGLYGQPPRWLIAAAVGFALTWFLIWGVSRWRTWPLPALVLLVAADLLLMDVSLVEGRHLEAAFSEGEAVARFLVQRDIGRPFRVYSPSYSLPRHIAARYGLETADGVDPLYLAAYDRLMTLATGVERRHYTVTVPAMEGEGPLEQLNRDAVPDARLLGLLNVRYVAAEFPIHASDLHLLGRVGGTYLYENARYLPRAFLVGRVETVSSVEQALVGVRTHDPQRIAFVEGGRVLDAEPEETGVVWLERTPNRLRLRVSTTDAAFLVLSQAWYPGWTVLLDGQPISLYRTDGALSGVYVPAGEHDVVFRFQAPAYRDGVWISVLGMGVALGLMYWFEVKRVSGGGE